MYLETFYCAFLETAAWQAADADGDSLDGYSFSNAAETLAWNWCDEFVSMNNSDLEGLDAAQCGHDFALTANRHGAGFWDRGLGEKGQRLTDAAHPYGYDVYLSDDGELELN